MARSMKGDRRLTTLRITQVQQFEGVLHISSEEWLVYSHVPLHRTCACSGFPAVVRGNQETSVSGAHGQLASKLVNVEWC